MHPPDGGSQPPQPPPFQPDNGSGSRTTLLVLAGLATIVIAAIAVVLWVVLRDKHTGSSTVAATSSGSTSATTSMTSSTSAPSPSTSAAHSSTPEVSPGGVSVTVDGVSQKINGQPACVAAGGDMNIAVGDSSSSLAVVLSLGDAPEVQTVAIVLNGEPLTYHQGIPGGADASASKAGNTYTITGHAMGMPDLSNPTAPPLKAFSIQVSCP